jgi:hypothetical protein
MTSFFRFVNKRAIYVHVIDFPVVNVHVDELSSARIWQHKLCVTYSANVNINNRLPIKVFVLLDISESLNTSPSEQLKKCNRSSTIDTPNTHIHDKSLN